VPWEVPGQRAGTYFRRTGLGCPQRNIFRQTLQHAAELIVSQLTWSPSVGIHKLSDQQHVLGEHRAMRGSPSSKHDACAVVSEDTIAKAAAESHGDDDSGGAACGSVPRHRRAPPFSSDPHPALHPTTHQLVVRHTPAMQSTMLNHMDIEFVTSLIGAAEVDLRGRRARARPPPLAKPNTK
jgi:hypothetical protein